MTSLDEQNDIKVGDVEVQDARGGEVFGSKFLTVDGIKKSGVDVNVLGDEVSIRNLRTSDDSKRKGYAKALVDDLFKEFPDKKITVTGMTDDGKPFFSKYYNINSETREITPKTVNELVNESKPNSSSMSFIKELNEARLIRRLDRIDGKDISELGRTLFNHLLALRLLHYEDPKAAAKYAKQIMRHPEFNGFRVTSPDIFNLVVFIQNKNRFADRIEIDDALSVPEMRLRRNLREIESGKINANDYEKMMLILQRQIDGLGSAHYQLRRETNDYPRLPENQKVQVIKRLLLLIRNPVFFSDLHMVLKRVAQAKGYVV